MSKSIEGMIAACATEVERKLELAQQEHQTVQRAYDAARAKHEKSGGEICGLESILKHLQRALATLNKKNREPHAEEDDG